MAHKLFNLADARKYARRRMPRMTFDYIDGSAGDERACALNVEIHEAILL
jgi:isopentenyl diphosphate isomerase/L-lactate dehydrogenase-like FMN-dependent dehydrogenase